MGFWGFGVYLTERRYLYSRIYTSYRNTSTIEEQKKNIYMKEKRYNTSFKNLKNYKMKSLLVDVKHIKIHFN